METEREAGICDGDAIVHNRGEDYMAVSLNRGTPIWTPKYYSPYYWDPQKGTPNIGKPPYLVLE